MTEHCPQHHRRTRKGCQLPENHEGWHQNKENGRTVNWNEAAAYIPKAQAVNVIIPDNFRATLG